MNAAWDRRRRNQRWRILSRRLARAPLGTPVVQRMRYMTVTATLWPADHRFEDEGPEDWPHDEVW